MKATTITTTVAGQTITFATNDRRAADGFMFAEDYEVLADVRGYVHQLATRWRGDDQTKVTTALMDAMLADRQDGARRGAMNAGINLPEVAAPMECDPDDIDAMLLAPVTDGTTNDPQNPSAATLLEAADLMDANGDDSTEVRKHAQVVTAMHQARKLVELIGARWSGVDEITHSYAVELDELLANVQQENMHGAVGVLLAPMAKTLPVQ